MRMVSNRHLSPNSVKRFKKVHVIRKVYVSKPVVEKPFIEPPVIDERQEDIDEHLMNTVQEEENRCGRGE